MCSASDILITIGKRVLGNCQSMSERRIRISEGIEILLAEAALPLTMGLAGLLKYLLSSGETKLGFLG